MIQLQKYSVLLAALLLAAPDPVKAADSYFMDAEHTEIRFYYSHGGVSEQSGEFTKSEGDAVLDEGDPSKSSVSIVIDADSVTSGVAHLDEQLKSPYYFWIKDHPKITFESTEVKLVGSKEYAVAGDLTIRGVTNSVTFNVEIRHEGEHPVGRHLPYYKGQWLGAYAEATLLRSDFGMDSYIPTVSDRVRVEINTELKMRKKE